MSTRLPLRLGARRERLAAAEVAERRRLERALRDGAQQRLVAARALAELGARPAAGRASVRLVLPTPPEGGALVRARIPCASS